MRRSACASGAARPPSVRTSRRSRCGSTGPPPEPRTRCRRQPEAIFDSQDCHVPRDAGHSAEAAMVPKVLISDALSPAAVQIFKDRGLEVEFQPKLGADKEKLADLVGDFDGLAI